MRLFTRRTVSYSALIQRKQIANFLSDAEDDDDDDMDDEDVIYEPDYEGKFANQIIWGELGLIICRGGWWNT